MALHHVLAGRQTNLMADMPLTLAETASVFGEMLDLPALRRGETTLAARSCLPGKVETC